ncbi:MAG TPA: aminotransferase class I and II [Ferruginibacter sp.]|nr:aminotransferase class I and II [Niastella sp.]HRB30521.1 aminotransferase class I and II [Ferruginibacter sp.]
MEYRAELRTVNVTRYVMPLREGGSLPAIAEADDEFLYVLKFRGAGQGIKALVAELLGAELARLAGLKVPEIVFALLNEAFGRTEPDEEIQDLLKASTGLNIALHYLSGAVSFDAAVSQPDALLASKIVWLDALLLNVDRTARNTNMLHWNKELWLIDHGAALYFHHSWQGREKYINNPFVQIKDHVLLPFATCITEADVYMKNVFTPQAVSEIVNLLPDEWLQWDDAMSPQQIKDFYVSFLSSRIQHSSIFVKQIQDAGK